MTNSGSPGQQHTPLGLGEFVTGLTSLFESAGEWVLENRELLQVLLVGFGESIGDLSRYPQIHLPLVKQEDVNTLMQNGWYPPSDASSVEVRLLAEGFEEDTESANHVLIERYRSGLDDIESSLRSTFPNRVDILGDAFEAHRQEKYNLSVPLLLIQADGVWLDRCSRNLFSGGVNSAVDDLVNKVPDITIREVARALLYKEWPLVLSSKNRSIGFSELNRHQIIHGEVTDYGTEENSLKAVAFLNFCALVLPDS